MASSGTPSYRALPWQEAFASQSQSSWLLRGMRQDFLRWTPRPAFDLRLQECWESQESQACVEKLPDSVAGLGAWLAPLASLSISFPLSPFRFQFAEITDSRGTRIQVLEAFHPSKDPLRPLILLRAGIFSNTTEFFPERFLMIQLLEQMNFDVVLVESSSGNEFLKRNRSLQFGGAQESLQNKELARIYRKLYPGRSLHLVGVSLGGHSVMAEAQDRESLFASLTALCPLIDLPSTWEFHQQNPVFLWIANLWVGLRMKDVHLGFDWGWRPLENLFSYIQAKDPEFWARNSFHKALSVQRPLWVLASQSDALVPYSLNSGRFLQNQKGVQLVSVLRGNHCSLPLAYPWNAFVPPIEQHILKAASLERPRRTSPLHLNSTKLRIRVTPQGQTEISERRWGFGQRLQVFDWELPMEFSTEAGRLANERWLSAQIRKRESLLEVPLPRLRAK